MGAPSSDYTLKIITMDHKVRDYPVDRREMTVKEVKQAV